MKLRYHRDVWVGAILLVFCGAALSMSLNISGQASYLPTALSVLMALCALIIIIGGLRKTREVQGSFQYAITWKDSKSAFIFMGFIAIYYLLFRYVSYWIATPVFLIFTQKHLKVKSWKINLIVTVCYLVISYILFVIILKLPIYKIGILGKYFRYI